MPPLNEQKFSRQGCVFSVSRPTLMSQDAMLRKFLGQFTILDARPRWDHDGVEYVALHPKLPVVQEGDDYPRYRLEQKFVNVVGTFKLGHVSLKNEQGGVVLELLE